ncbi:MAG TPA: hypothetical protein VFQ61_36950 [Polyangiaceae bacterium]|nr:hypothetical protein [Polyangiaceae bacterium]
MEFQAGPFSPAFEAQVLSDFRAGLAEEKIAICHSQDPGPEMPLATVRVSAESASNVSVSVDVRDAVTEKRVGRDVDLSRVPRDGRAFAVALAADELLRASWAEVILKRAQSRGRRAPAAVRVAVERVLPSPLVKDHERPRVGVRGAVEHYGRGLTLYGGDIALETTWFESILLDVHVGGRSAVERKAAHGTIAGSALELGLDLGGRWLWGNARAVRLAWFGGVDASWLTFRGSAAGTARDYDWSGLGLAVHAGGGAGVRLVGPVWFEARASLGATVRTLEALDGTLVAASASGLKSSLAVGIGVEL